jgi:hypothetical protein
LARLSEEARFEQLAPREGVCGVGRYGTGGKKGRGIGHGDGAYGQSYSDGAGGVDLDPARAGSLEHALARAAASNVRVFELLYAIE